MPYSECLRGMPKPCRLFRQEARRWQTLSNRWTAAGTGAAAWAADMGAAAAMGAASGAATGRAAVSAVKGRCRLASARRLRNGRHLRPRTRMVGTFCNEMSQWSPCHTPSRGGPDQPRFCNLRRRSFGPLTGGNKIRGFFKSRLRNSDARGLRS